MRISWKLLIIFIMNIKDNIVKILFLIIDDKHNFSLSYLILYNFIDNNMLTCFQKKMILKIRNFLQKNFCGLGWFNIGFYLVIKIYL